MSQNLPAPCYQVYAANVLANLSFRQADLSARGLVYTLLCELWVNNRLPSNPATLARVLGLDAGEVAAALPASMPFFSIDGEGIFSPQLEDYRKHLNEIREKQKNGGKKGAERAIKNKELAATPADIGLDGVRVDPQVDPQVDPRVSSIVKQSTVNQSQVQPLKKRTTTEREEVNDEWVDSYKAAEGCTADAYASARG